MVLKFFRPGIFSIQFNECKKIHLLWAMVNQWMFMKGVPSVASLRRGIFVVAKQRESELYFFVNSASARDRCRWLVSRWSAGLFTPSWIVSLFPHGFQGANYLIIHDTLKRPLPRYLLSLHAKGKLGTTTWITDLEHDNPLVGLMSES